MQPVNLTVRQCAEVLGLGITKVRQLIQTGEILSFHEGRRLLVPLRAIEEYEQQRLEAARAQRDGHLAREQRRRQFRKRPA
jgi:excisionase family DNA binding protein